MRIFLSTVGNKVSNCKQKVDCHNASLFGFILFLLSLDGMNKPFVKPETLLVPARKWIAQKFPWQALPEGERPCSRFIVSADGGSLLRINDRPVEKSDAARAHQLLQLLELDPQH
jgi:hypothetical protein